MEIKYILNVTTLEELKKEYKQLALIHHPDVGGDTEAMKAINVEYDFLFEKLKNTHKNKDGEYYTKENTAETAGEWKDIIDSLIQIHMEGATIEIIGSFVWVSGNTKPYKEQLKELNFKWSQNKESWYMPPEGYRRQSRKKYNLNEIRDMYGSSRVKNEQKNEDKKKSPHSITA